MLKKTQGAVYYLATSIALATFIVYLAALQNDFVEWDDSEYILDNFHIRSLDAAFFKWAFLDFHAANWHPLTWISHALDYTVWGVNPMGHHLTSIVLHAANTFLVVLLVVRLIEIREKTWLKTRLPAFLKERTKLIIAGATGLLFGLHPVHVESVAWVAERKDVLCALFFLLSILSYTGSIGGQGAGGRRQESEGGGNAKAGLNKALISKHYLLTLGFFVLALLSKPMAITLPFVLLILDWYPFERIRSFEGFRSALVEKLPFFALSFASSIVTVLAQRAGGALVPMETLPLLSRLLVAADALTSYLGKMLWPLNLVPFYPHPKTAVLLSLDHLWAIILVLGVTAICIRLSKSRKLWMAAWSYYVMTLLPVLGLVQTGGQSMADRYLYLPSLGPFLVAGLTTGWCWGKLQQSKKWSSRGLFAIAALILVFASLSYLTFRQIGIWKNSNDLWSYVIEKEHDRVPLAYNQRGSSFFKKGQLDRSIEDYSNAITLNPSYSDAYNNRGMAFFKMGRFDKAMDDFDKAIALNPSYSEAYNNRGLVFEAEDQFDKAIEDFDKAIALDPSHYKAYNNRGTVYGKERSFARAIESFNQSIALNPNFADAYFNRGLTHAFAGRDDSALEDFNKTIELNHEFAAAYLNRGNLYLKAGNRGLALEDFRRACNLGFEAGCKALP